MNMNMNFSSITGWFDDLRDYFSSLAPDDMAAWATIAIGLLLLIIGLIVM